MYSLAILLFGALVELVPIAYVIQLVSPTMFLDASKAGIVVFGLASLILEHRFKNSIMHRIVTRIVINVRNAGFFLVLAVLIVVPQAFPEPQQMLAARDIVFNGCVLRLFADAELGPAIKIDYAPVRWRYVEAILGFLRQVFFVLYRMIEAQFKVFSHYYLPPSMRTNVVTNKHDVVVTKNLYWNIAWTVAGLMVGANALFDWCQMFYLTRPTTINPIVMVGDEQSVLLARIVLFATMTCAGIASFNAAALDNRGRWGVLLVLAVMIGLHISSATAIVMLLRQDWIFKRDFQKGSRSRI